MPASEQRPTDRPTWTSIESEVRSVRPASPGEWSRPASRGADPALQPKPFGHVSAGLGLGFGFAGNGLNSGMTSGNGLAGSRQVSGGPVDQAALMQWLEREVVSRLFDLDTKMDQLVLQMRQGERTEGKEPLVLNGDALRAAAGFGSPRRPMSSSIATPPHEVQEILEVRAVGINGAPTSAKPVDDGIASVASPKVLDDGITSNYSLDTIEPDSKGSVRQSRRDGSQASCTLLESRTLHRRDSEVAVWNFLADPESSTKAARWALAMPLVSLIAVLVTLLQSFDPPLIYGVGAAVGEVCFEVFFAVELLMRFLTCPSRRKFIGNVHNWIDALAVTPIFLRAAVGWEIPAEEGQVGSFQWWARNILICIVPIIRLFRTLRRFERFRLVQAAFEQTVEALPILLFTLCVLTLIFSALIFMVEPRDNVASLQRAAWLTIVTMTTVGYGDIVPVSGAGNLVVTVLVISSVLYMAMPLGIVGQAFNKVWNDRDRLLLVLRTKERLKQWGYTAHDVCVLFRWFDEDGSGELDVDEFEHMVTQMRLGLSRRRTIELFRGIDIDNGGTIDVKEFVKYLFPEDYYVIFGNDVSDDGDDDDNDEGKEKEPKAEPSGEVSHWPSSRRTSVVKDTEVKDTDGLSDSSSPRPVHKTDSAAPSEGKDASSPPHSAKPRRPSLTQAWGAKGGLQPREMT